MKYFGFWTSVIKCFESYLSNRKFLFCIDNFFSEAEKFNGNPSHWPEFFQCFKERVYMKRTFSDSVRMERLLSVLDGDAKRVVSAIGRNGLFYAAALKALIKEFGIPYAVSFLKLKAVLDQSQIQADDQKGL